MNNIKYFGFIVMATSALTAAEPIKPDLQKLAREIGPKPGAEPKVEWKTGVKGKDALFARNVVWIPDITFSEGTIECDILGQSLPRGSNFTGLAFHAIDDTTLDCVYFRPFNFRADNPENAGHAVQYISHPQWTWNRLREEKTGQFEKPITPAPDGDEWFHARIVVAGPKVSVFVNDATKPCLEVQKLNDRTAGKIGIWWNGDARFGGYFANLKITPKD